MYLFKENINLQTPATTGVGGIIMGQNFNTTIQNIPNSGTDLISSYSVVQPLSASGFHVNANTPLSPTMLRPPKPLPRHSVINKTVNSNESSGMIKSQSELALHLLVSSKCFSTFF